MGHNPNKINMKKLIALLFIVTLAVVFPVKDTSALPQTCTTSTNPDGSGSMFCGDNIQWSYWEKKCAYCPYEKKASGTLFD